MTKIRVKSDNGFVWEFDAHHVAHDRAKYYEENDGDTTYQVEYDYTIRDDSELIDWLANNMDFDPDKFNAIIVDAPEPSKNPEIVESEVVR